MPAARVVCVIVASVALATACSRGPGPELLATTDDDTTRPTVVVVDDDATAAAAAASSTTAPPTTAPPTTEPPPPQPLVVYDTDMGPDIDDALALAMLHGYQQQGLIELAGVTVSRDSTVAARYVDALNTFYGRPDVPVGIDRVDPPFYDDQLYYVSLVDRWPHDLAAAEVDDGYRVLRRVLADAAASGRRVLIVQTGFSGNLSHLLDSPGDEISPLNGVELVIAAGAELSIMAGSLTLDIVEFNIEKDVPTARNLFRKWPGPLTLAPFELGDSIHYPYTAVRDQLAWIDPHPVRQAYEFADLEWHVDAPPFYDMRSWDLTAVIQGVEPEAGYFLVSGPGTVTLDGTGRTSFQPGDGRHLVLDRAASYSEDQRRRILDRMIELVSHRP